MMMLLTAIINQSEIKVLRKQVDWDEILKISDFHHILSVVYYGMLGIEKEISEECADKFFQKYKKGILLNMEYKNAEQAISWQLERHGIHALFLTKTHMYGFYPKRDMAYIERLEILVSKKELPFVHGFMREMDYEEKENRVGHGILYTRTPGIQVVFYDEIPLGNKGLKKYFSVPVKKYANTKKYRHIHSFVREEEYLYMAGRLVEQYVRGDLKVRDIMDLWQYRKGIGKEFQWNIVNDVLEKAKIQGFVQQVQILAELWFGGKTDEQCGIAIELEEYIMSQGEENQWLDSVILPHERERLDFYRRDREEEWSLKRKEWRFPPRDYMEQLFPVLKKHPGLLPFFWIVREFRYYKTRLQRSIAELRIRQQRNWLELKERLAAKFGRQPSENPADENAENGNSETEEELAMPEFTSMRQMEEKLAEESAKPKTEEEADTSETAGGSEEESVISEEAETEAKAEQPQN